MRSHMIFTWQHARLDTDGGKRGAASWPAQTSGRRNHHSDERWLPHTVSLKTSAGNGRVSLAEL